MYHLVKEEEEEEEEDSLFDLRDDRLQVDWQFSSRVLKLSLKSLYFSRLHDWWQFTKKVFAWCAKQVWPFGLLPRLLKLLEFLVAIGPALKRRDDGLHAGYCLA